MILSIKTEGGDVVKRFAEDTDARLKGESFIKNPFNGGAKLIENTVIVDITPIFPSVWIVGAAVLGAELFFIGLYWWVFIFPAFVAVYTFLRSRYFLFWGFRKGLRKAGYAGETRLLDNQDVLRVILWENGKF